MNLGTAWAASLGSSGARPQHIEESLHRAAAVPGNVPVQCPITGTSIVVKNQPAERVRLQNLARLRSLRLRRQLSNAGKGKGRGKGDARLKRRPEKKRTGRNSEDTPSTYMTWPVLLPHLLFQSVISAGLLRNMMLNLSGIFCLLL